MPGNATFGGPDREEDLSGLTLWQIDIVMASRKKLQAALRRLREENEQLREMAARAIQATQSESGIEDLEESASVSAVESQARVKALEIELQLERDEHESHLAGVRNECEDLRKERDRLKGEVEEKSREVVRVQENCEREKKELRLTAELRQLKAVEEAQKEFRVREQELQRQLAVDKSVSVDTVGSTDSDRSGGNGDPPQPPKEPPTTLTSALLTQQLQLIGKFTGENDGGHEETFMDWIEQLELVAEAFGLDDQTQYINVVTRLRGQALTFYRSCDKKKMKTYTQLVDALRERFMPVRLKAVESSLFHERKQKENETVDSYAQELRKLFYRAYPKAKQGDGETESMAKDILAYQFVAGLKLEIKEKLAGVEGDFDQLLAKARFKEAKMKEWRNEVPKAGRTQRAPTDPAAREEKKPPPSSNVRRKESSSIRCHNCGGLGHIARQCTVTRRATPRETQAQGGPARSSHQVNGLDSHRESSLDSYSGKPKKMAVERASATLNTLTTGEPEQGLVLGPKLRTELLVDGMPATALVDTGSPITIISLSYLLQIWWTQRDKSLPRWKWKEEAVKKLADPTIALKAYNGTQLNVLAEATVTLGKGPHHCKATVMVQEDAPQDVLLGTDCLSQLGIQLTGLEEPPHPVITEETTVMATVKLLNPTRIPAGFGRPVRAALVKGVEIESKRLWMLEPSNNLLDQGGATIEPALVELDEDQQMTVVVNNCGRNPVHLEAGERLGTLIEVELTPLGEATEEVQSLSVNTLSSNRSEANDSNRDVHLCQALGVDAMKLTLTQKDELVKLLLQ